MISKNKRYEPTPRQATLYNATKDLMDEIADLKEQLAQAEYTADLMVEIVGDYRARLAQVKGDWADAPEWAKFRAYDLDGRGTWFAARPSAMEYGDGRALGWVSSFGSQRVYLKDWKNSLEERPDKDEFEARIKEILSEHQDAKRR